MNTKRVLASVAAGALTLLLGAGPAMAQDAKAAASDKPAAAQPKTDKKDKAKKDDKADTDLTVGAAAPDFKLKDTTGKEYNLSQLTKSGKIVVLQWFNPECPYVKKHYEGADKTFNNLNTKYKDKGVVLLAINSGAAGNPGSGAERSAAAAKKWNMQYPILMDDTQSVGKAYSAKNTPAMVVIGKDGKVAYMGAIDDDNGPDKPGKTNYVANAVDQLLAGTAVTNSKTKPYGCHITYKDNN